MLKSFRFNGRGIVLAAVAMLALAVPFSWSVGDDADSAETIIRKTSPRSPHLSAPWADFRVGAAHITGSETDLEPIDDPETTEVVAMMRVTYKLSAGKSELLGKLLKAILTDEGDIKVKGDSLQITATEEDQVAIRGLVKLAMRHTRPNDPSDKLRAHSVVVDPDEQSDESSTRTRSIRGAGRN